MHPEDGAVGGEPAEDAGDDDEGQEEDLVPKPAGALVSRLQTRPAARKPLERPWFLASGAEAFAYSALRWKTRRP